MQDTFDRHMLLSITVLLEQNGLLIRSVACQRFATEVSMSEGGREVCTLLFPVAISALATVDGTLYTHHQFAR